MDKNQKNEKEDFIIFATADWDTPYWTNKQHMAREFSMHGHRVLYIESIGLRKPKINSSSDWKRIFFRLLRGLSRPKNVDLRIWVLSPLVLPYSFKHIWIKEFNEWMMALQIKRFTDKYKFINPYLWTYHPYILELNKRLKFKNKIIYHCVDDLSAIPGIDKKSFNFQEKNLLKKADCVFVTSKILENKCRKYNKETHYFSNVVDFEHFSSAYKQDKIPMDLEKIPEPRLVFVGVLSEFKIDLELLEDLVKKLPDCNFVFLGDEIEGQSSAAIKRISSCQNSFFLGHKSYNELPKYLAYCHIGLLIVKRNKYTKSMSPMKFYEYIAAGLYVVSNNRFYDLTEKEFFLVGNSSDEISNLILKTLEKNKLTFKQSKLAIGKNTWKKRLEFFYSILEEIEY